MAIDASPIPVRNIWYLLLYAWDKAAFRDRWRADSEAAPDLQSLLAKVLADRTDDLLSRGLGRSYVPKAETIRGVRGRVDFATSLKRLTFENGQAHCRFSHFSINVLRNQILRTTLHRLSRATQADARRLPKAAALYARLGKLASSLDGIDLVELHEGLFDRVQLGRNDTEYSLIMDVCRLLHRLAMPTQDSGRRSMNALSDLNLPGVFEAFVRNFYRAHTSDRYEVGGEHLQWPDEYHCRFAPAMKTDVTLTSKEDGSRLIIECKFSQTTLAQYRGKEVFKSPNLYQLYAYLRTQADKSTAHRATSGLLLYPTVNDHVDEQMYVQAHRIRIATVDLAAHWPLIEDRLLELVAPWPSIDGAHRHATPVVSAIPA